ncbi:hypothetical protein ES708_06122 [subsurface metagenome]
MDNIDITQGDYGYNLNFTVTKADGTAREITDYTVTLIVWAPGTPETNLLTNGACVPDVPASGTCHYVLKDGDFDDVGYFYAKLELTIAENGIVESQERFSITVKGMAVLGTAALVTLLQAKNYLRVDDSADDESIMRLIEAATKIAEDSAGRTFIQAVITENRIGNGDRLLSLRQQPIVTITSVKLDGVTLTRDTDYIELLDMGWLKRGSGWTKDKAIIIVYTAGYGEDRDATQALIPDAVTAVLLILADLYENRGDTVDSINISGLGSTSYKLPSRAEKMLSAMKPQGGFA